MSANRFRFRAWDNYEGMTHDVVMGSKGFTATWKGQGGLRIGQEFDAKNIDAILMQSTGLLDRNQKEIFEGDILSSDEYVINPANHVAVVKWKNGAFGFDIIALSELLRDDGLIDSIVIGNIYENPELLK